MLKFIYSLNEINSWIIFLIGTIGSLWSIIELVKKKELKKRIVVVFIMGLCTITLSLISKGTRQVPELVGKTYSQAVQVLVNNDIDFESIQNVSEYKVIDQMPKAGTIQWKNSKVQIEVESKADYEERNREFVEEQEAKHKEKIIKQLEEEKTKFVKVNATLFETKVSVVNKNGKEKYALAKEVNTEKIENAILINEEHHIVFNEYVNVERYKSWYKNTLSFTESVPIGRYKISLKAKGYDKKVCELDLKDCKDSSVDVNMYLNPTIQKPEYMYRVHIVDSNYREIKVDQICLKLSKDDNEIGRIINEKPKSMFWLKSGLGKKIYVQLTGENMYCKCSIKYSQAENDLFIVVKNDFSAYQGTMEEYLNATT